MLQNRISLRQTADVVPLWDKFPEPLHAIYSKTCLPPIEENLKATRLKITRFYGQVTVRYSDENCRSFADVAPLQNPTQAQQTAEE